MIITKEYPPCPKCEGITYPTFDNKTRNSRKDVLVTQS